VWGTTSTDNKPEQMPGADAYNLFIYLLGLHSIPSTKTGQVEVRSGQLTVNQLASLPSLLRQKKIKINHNKKKQLFFRFFTVHAPFVLLKHAANKLSVFLFLFFYNLIFTSVLLLYIYIYIYIYILVFGC